MEQRQPPVWAEILLATMSLAGTMLIIWGNLPPQERAWIRLGTRRWLYRVLTGLAWREGRAGIREEAAGRDPAVCYAIAERFGRWRDRLADR